ncbi:insulinase family protein [Candidatus Poriferisocius sp.]|uniref:insulinase family protein n=1 Tax=Candidatus Poriferisocius sp. TaxID=3101276 RepID=UPI003B01F994
MKKLLILFLSVVLALSACSDNSSNVPVTGSSPVPVNGSSETPVTGSPEAEAVGGRESSGETGSEIAERPLPVDPEVRIGTLDNGLTYYLRSNDSPGGSLSLRLAVNAGSRNEEVPGSGIAHYLEHMLFNGTEKFPGNELTETLHSIGIEFGPDINAYTTYDDTVYELDLIIDQQEQSVATAFEVLSQWAHAATLDPRDVEKERGIVRDEYRLSVETGSSVISSKFDDLYTKDTPYAGRDPIGTAAGIESVTAEQLRDFYETWYVPSNMAVIAVGDLALDELEELVQAYFHAIPAGDGPPSASEYRSAPNQDPIFDVATSPEQGYSYLSLDIRLPSWDSRTVEGDRELWIEEIIAVMVENHLQAAYEQGGLSQIDPPHWMTFEHTRGLRYYGTNLRADDHSTALTDYWSLLLSLKEHGFTDEDLARAAESIGAALASALQAETTIQDSQYADLYSSHFLEGNDIGTLTDTMRRVVNILEDIEVGELNDRYRQILDSSGPILIAVGADPAEVPTAEEMEAALGRAEPGELPASIQVIAELLVAPDPAEAVSAGPLDVWPEAYEWSFANGARVVFAPSDISDNTVVLLAEALGGWSAMEPGDRPLAQALATRAVSSSGVGDFSPAQLSRYLEGRTVEVTPYIYETTEGVEGTSDAGDIETMFQLMHLYMTQPRVEQQAFAEAISTGRNYLALADSNPDWQAGLAYLEARYGRQWGWFDPLASHATLDSLTPDTLLDVYRQRLVGVDDLVVVVEGDVDQATVEQLARTYVGTLPAGEADSFVNRRPSEPEGVIRHEIQLGPDNTATSATYYYEAPLTAITPAVEVAGDVLEVLLNDRLTEDVREDLGSSYTTFAEVTLRLMPEPVVESLVLVTGNPDRMADIEAEMTRILDDIISGGITQAELEQARSVVADDYSLISNYDFINVMLRRVHTDDDELPTPDRLDQELSDLDLADIQELAMRLYDPNQNIQIVRVVP